MWWVFLAAAIPSIVKQVLIMLGIGLLTYVGLDAAFTGIVSAIQSNISGIPSDILLLLSLIGFIKAMAIMLGAISARIAMTVISSYAKIV